MTRSKSPLWNFVILLAFLLCAFAESFSQDPSGIDFGIVPNGAYEAYHIDSVNMESGLGVIHIPLFSLPQRGKLALSFSINANTSPWRPLYYCDSTGDCTYTYQASVDQYVNSTWGFGPSIIADQLNVAERFTDDTSQCYFDSGTGTQQCDNYHAYSFSVLDSTGAQHPLLLNSNDTTQFRSTDGSGYLWLAGRSDADYADSNGQTPTLLTSAGLSYTQGIPSNQFTTIRDADNNSLYSQTGPLPVDSSSDYVHDSVGRVVPSATSTTTSGCPNLNAQYQDVSSAAQWTVPGPNGSVTYKLCYTLIQIRTGFFSNGVTNCSPVGSGDSWVCYDDITEQEKVIQSVILPNGTYYGFTYDAADPNNSNSIAYGTIKSVILPTGGTISYDYSMLESCEGIGESTYAPGISKRTVSDLNGHQYVWSYSIPRPFDSGYVGNVATDPDLNDTVYKYTAYFPSGNLCAQHETDRQYYQGSSTSGGAILKDIQTTYNTIAAPEVTDFPYTETMFDLASQVTAINSDGTKAIQTSSYTSQNFSAFARTCPVAYYPCTNGSNLSISPVVSTPIGIQTSETITNESAATLRRTVTSYAWQDGSQNASYYWAANVLNSPTVTQTFDANNNLLSQTTTSYDDSSYVTNQSVYAGHPTTITRMNNYGSNVVTNTHWNQYGMPDYVRDGNQVTAHTYTYDSTDQLFVVSDTDAAGNQTSMVPDLATGKPTSITDVNGKTTGYAYDSMGRVTAITYPDSGSLQYNYHSDPVPPELSVSKATGTSAGSVVTTIMFDGLGRAIRGSLDSAPGSAIVVDKTYNWADSPLSISNPYVSNGSPSGYTTYAYDGLGRTHLICNPDNGTGSGACTAGNSYQEWDYAGSTTIFKDELRHAWTRTTDALGRLSKVVEPNGAATYYMYDALGNLTCTAQDGGAGGTFTSCASAPASWRPRSFTYDSLSRLVAANNPETGTVCYGTLSGTSCTEGYDGNSNLQSKTDARGVITHFAYDNLNRLLSKTYSATAGASSAVQALAGGTPSNCYKYDFATNGKERLWFEWTATNGCSSFSSPPSNGFLSLRVIGSYDAMGRVSSEQQCVSGYCTSPSVPAQPPANCSTLTTVAGLQYCYDLAGGLLAYSSGVTAGAAGSYPQAATYFSQTFDGAGRLATVSSSWNDVTHPAQVFGATGTNSYTPANALSNWLLGGNLYTARAFDVRNRVCKQQSSLQPISSLQCP